LFGVAVFYVLLSAGFFAVVQVIIYIGAIAILFIFAVMLTDQVARETDQQSNNGW
jgi:NADH-quinone oxidoreductase subunit J